MVLVSVIITLYNGEKYAQNCIESVLSLRKDSNIEIIVIDDGSTDNTETICYRYVKEGTVKYIKQDNSGVSVARNRGIDEAMGTYIMFVDGDDWVDANIITTLMQEAKGQEDILACCCMVNADDLTYPEYFFKKNYVFEDDSSKTPLFKQLLNPAYDQDVENVYAAIGVPWGKLYRRDFLENNSLRFDPDLRRMQDNVFNMKAFECAYKIIYINEPLYNYRSEHISAYRKPYASDNLFKVHCERKKFFEEHAFFENEELKDSYYADAVHLHIEADKYEILTYDRKDAIKKIEYNSKRFQTDIPNRFWNINRTNKLFRWCIHHKRFGLLYDIYKTYNVLNNYLNKR